MNNDFSAELTPAEAERLHLLIEECSEVQRIACKILRHGYESYNPFDTEKVSNRSLLENEMGDLCHALNLMWNVKDVSRLAVHDAELRKLESVKPYLHHQEMTP